MDADVVFKDLALLLLCQMRDINSTSGGMPLLKTCATHYHTQQKSREFKGLVGCNIWRVSAFGPAKWFDSTLLLVVL